MSSARIPFYAQVLIGFTLVLALGCGGLLLLTARWASDRVEQDVAHRLAQSADLLAYLHATAAKARADRFSSLVEEPRYRALAQIFGMDDASATLQQLASTVDLDAKHLVAFGFGSPDGRILAFKGAAVGVVRRALSGLLAHPGTSVMLASTTGPFEAVAFPLHDPFRAGTVAGYLIVAMPFEAATLNQYGVVLRTEVELRADGRRLLGTSAAAGEAPTTRAIDVPLSDALRFRIHLDVADVAEPFDATMRHMALLSLLVLLVGAGVSVLLARRIAAPIRYLTAAAEAAETCLAVRVEERGALELRALARRFNTMIDSLEHAHLDLEQRVVERTSELRAANDSLHKEIVEHQESERRRLEVEVQLRQAQKLESIGQLAAGVAHEINTPIQYVGDNLRFLTDAFTDYRKLVEGMQALGEVDGDGVAPARASIAALLAEADVAYLDEEVPRAAAQALEGVERVAKIVRAMKEFSHPGGEGKVLTDLNAAIETTLTVAKNEWKYVADVLTELDPELPPVACRSEVNQVILNLVVNAAHAIKDAIEQRGEEKGTITVRTRADGGWAEIQVADTGTGIPEEARPRIFDPFFTTKPVGQGSGQGLSIARQIVTTQHGGTISFDTEIGVGTTFTVRLPVAEAVAVVARPVEAAAPVEAAIV